MAIDTENKRRAVAIMLPIPDGDIAAEDRRQVAWLYSGIFEPGIPVDCWTARERCTDWMGSNR